MTTSTGTTVGTTGTAVETRGGQLPFVNMTGLPDEALDGSMREIANQVTRWVSDQRGARNKSSLFDRSAYQSPDNPYDQMRTARTAMANDDVVSGAAEVTEGLIFQGIKWESETPDDADVFNQMARTLDLDSYVRAAYRELFTCSQVVTASWWAWHTYTVRGRSNPEDLPLEPVTDPETGAVGYTDALDPVTHRPAKRPKGIKRKKKYRVWGPVALTVLDSTRVVPIGNLLWGTERLAWVADKAELDAFRSGEDPTMTALFVGPYTPVANSVEEAELTRLGVDCKRLLELNPVYVWRHCITKPAYQRFAEVRLKSVFRLLDLKQQLMEADRVSLIGAANYILLIKKGTEKDPAYPEELTNLRENFATIAKLPVIVSDHRLVIEIVTPDQDFTLQDEKYDVLDRRILGRLLGSLGVASGGQRNETTLTATRGVARQLEAKRHMLKRTLERYIAAAVVEHPLNATLFEGEPNLGFTPRNVQIDSDSQVVQSVMALRTQKELSRESVLEYFGFDQAIEAQRREYEEESGLDDVFGTQVPFSAAAGGGPPGDGAVVAPSVSGATGGRPAGGGNGPANATKPKRKNPTPVKK